MAAYVPITEPVTPPPAPPASPASSASSSPPSSPLPSSPASKRVCHASVVREGVTCKTVVTSALLGAKRVFAAQVIVGFVLTMAKFTVNLASGEVKTLRRLRGAVEFNLKCAHTTNSITLEGPYGRRFLLKLRDHLTAPTPLPQSALVPVTLTDSADTPGNSYVFLVTVMTPDPEEDTWME